MKITTFTIEGPALKAQIPLPCPADTPVKPYPWDEFLSDMRGVLAEYAESDTCATTYAAMMSHLSDDGTCYWIRADLDDGTRFLRVYVSNDPDDEEISFDIDTCGQEAVPGRLRLN